MDPSFYKVVAFISFITLGWCLRKFNVLKPEAFQAISGLVMFVTLPCTTMFFSSAFWEEVPLT